jgi:dTDP-4-dehydrorhamnose 3,5-epimerase
LVRVLRGKILDVVVDFRRSSTTYGKHISVELSADGGEQLFVPGGLAHGFCTLVEDTEVFYKVDAVYSSAHDRGVHWLDPRLGIHWPVEASTAILSDKDKALPAMSALPGYFE